MRSSELASLAGVTVRALRHYHQLGLLEEPPRNSNGYRDYDVHHLIRVLRITRLSGLGFPLQDLPPMLDHPEADATGRLEELDHELLARIERLNAQREVLALLREGRAAPDLPPELGRYAQVFAAGALTPALNRFDREQIILLGHFIGEKGIPYLTRLYDRLAEPDVRDAMAVLTARIADLDDRSPDTAVERLVADTIEVLEPLLRELGEAVPEADLSPFESLIKAHIDTVLNDTQVRAMRLLEERVAEVLGEASQPGEGNSPTSH